MVILRFHPSHYPEAGCSGPLPKILLCHAYSWPIHASDWPRVKFKGKKYTYNIIYVQGDVYVKTKHWMIAGKYECNKVLSCIFHNNNWNLFWLVLECRWSLLNTHSFMTCNLYYAIDMYSYYAYNSARFTLFPRPLGFN